MIRSVLALALCAAWAPAHAALADADPLAELAPIDRAELGEARGGMMINGIPINFAVVMRTMVNDATPHGLETVFTVNDHGGLGSATTTAIGTSTGTTLTPTANGFALGLGNGTTIVHEVLAGQIRTLLSNTRDNVTLSQQTDLNIELPGFNAASQSWYSASKASRMGLDAALSGLSRR